MIKIVGEERSMDDIAEEVMPTRLRLLKTFGLMLLPWLVGGPHLHGATLVYSTFLGGAANDSGYAVTVDGQGNVYVVGDTLSTNSFPTLNALQPRSAGGQDLFIATQFSR